MTYAGEIDTSQFTYPVQKQEGSKVTFIVDETKENMADIMAKLMSYGTVLDVESKDVSLEKGWVSIWGQICGYG